MLNLLVYTFTLFIALISANILFLSQMSNAFAVVFLPLLQLFVYFIHLLAIDKLTESFRNAKRESGFVFRRVGVKVRVLVRKPKYLLIKAGYYPKTRL